MCSTASGIGSEFISWEFIFVTRNICNPYYDDTAHYDNKRERIQSKRAWTPYNLMTNIFGILSCNTRNKDEFLIDLYVSTLQLTS